MKRLLWISWHQTPYNDYLFDEIAEKFHLDVIYIRKILLTHPWKSQTIRHYKNISWENRKDKIVAISQILSNRYDLRIIAGWNNPLMALSLVFYFIFNKTYAIWTDTPQINPNRSWLKKTIHWIFVRKIVTGAKVILVTGETGVEKMLSIYSNVRVSNFPFATDLNFYQSARPSKLTETIRICSVGRLLNAHKGTDVAIEAFRLLKERKNALKFEYRIVGDGPDRISLNNQIKKYGLENEIKLMGWLEPTEIRDIYQQSDLFIHPSHVDPFPNAVLEAMACGLPVIGSDAAGSVIDRVTHNVNGYIFRDGDALQLSECMEALMQDQNKMEKFGQESRKVAELWPCQYNLDLLECISNK